MRVDWVGVWLAFWRVVAVAQFIVGALLVLLGEPKKGFDSLGGGCVSALLGWPDFQPSRQRAGGGR